MKTKKPDAVEKLALKWVIDGHEAGGVKAIRSLIRREVRKERDPLAAKLEAVATPYEDAPRSQVSITTHVGSHLRTLANEIRKGPK